MKGENKLVLKFLQKLNSKTNHTKNETEVQEIIPEVKKGLERVSFGLNTDEKIVIDFLSDMDRDFGSNIRDRVRQGDHFERFLAAMFKLAGYEVEITKKSYKKDNRVYTGDGGVDLILTTENERIAVQAKSKRLNSASDERLITDNDVKNFAGISDKNWTKKMFITSSFFNNYAYKQIAENEKAYKIEWYGRYELLKLLNQLIPETMLKHQLLNSLPKNIKICPKCNEGIMTPRKNGTTKKYFNACSLYCGHTENIKK